MDHYREQEYEGFIIATAIGRHEVEVYDPSDKRRDNPLFEGSSVGSAMRFIERRHERKRKALVAQYVDRIGTKAD